MRPERSSGSPRRDVSTIPMAGSPRSTVGTLVGLASELLREIDPDVVITFGPDGFSGHPDHIAVGAAVTAACYEMRSARPIRLFHCHLPRSRMLLRDRLAEWVVELTTRFKGTKDFVRALSVFSRETTALGYAADFVNVEWFPSGSYLIEQGEAATTMYFLLSGQVEIRREGEDGRVRVVDRSGPGEFIGEVGIATGQPRNAHVVAVDDVTSLTFSAAEPVPVDGRAEQAQLLRTRSLPSGDQIDARVSTCIDVSDFVGHKIRATAAHRSQYPIDPSMFPDPILREMFGVEYFIQVLPERELAHVAPRRVGQTHRDVASASALELRCHVVEQRGREVPLHPVRQDRAHVVPGAEAGGKPPRRGDVEPARRADAQAATTELARRGHCLRLRDQHRILESDGVRVEEPAHALDDARYPPDDLWVALRSERRGRHRSSDDRVVAVIPQRVRHAHQRAAGADTGDEAVRAERRPAG